MLTCSAIHYSDEFSNGAKVICRWLFRDRVQFYKIPSYRKLTHRGERGCFITPCEWMKKARQFDLIPRLANGFCQPHSSATHSCCTTGMIRTTTSVSTAHLNMFLFKSFSCFHSTRKHPCICLLMQTSRK